MEPDASDLKEDCAPVPDLRSAQEADGEVAGQERDPLAAPAFDSAPGPPEARGDGGVSDADRIVRIWLEGHRIVKVRLSPVWFHKVAARDTLESHFRQAMALSSLRVAEASAPPEQTDSLGADDALGDVSRLPQEVLKVFNGLPKVGPGTLTAFECLFADVNARIAAAEDAATPTPTMPVVSGSVRGVKVILNQAGFAVDVEFDQTWLDDAQVGAICTAVQIAADRAYAKFVPAVPERTVLDELHEEHSLLLDAYRAMLNPRRDY